MIRRGCVTAWRLNVASTSTTACKWCQSRNLVASRSIYKEEEEVTGRSALDELFDSPDAYDHQARFPKANKNFKKESFKSQRVPRTILGNDLSNDIASQLNQEWEGAPTQRTQYQPLNYRAPVRGPHIGSTKKEYRGTMTPSEAKVFGEIFDEVFYADMRKDISQSVDDGGLGSSLTTSGGDLEGFRQRNRLEQKNKLARKRFLSSVLSERISWANIKEEEIERKIDEAREEIVACSSVADIWQWAAKNVWGAETQEQQQDVLALKKEMGKKHKATAKSSKSATSQEVEATKSMEVANSVEKEGKEVRFGMLTPYYSPVLLLLLTNLRDRFTSPQSALSVIRIAKNLGPDSFVLGCSPQLYAEAVRTKWLALRDLEGARDTLREAKDTGILGRGSQVLLLADRPDPKDEESRLREIVSKQVKSDVRFQVVEGIKKIPKGQTVLWYERQLKLVQEMDTMLGTTHQSQSSSNDGQSYSSRARQPMIGQTTRRPKDKYARQ